MLGLMDFQVKRKIFGFLDAGFDGLQRRIFESPKLFAKVIFCTNTLHLSIEIHRHISISIYTDIDRYRHVILLAQKNIPDTPTGFYRLWEFGVDIKSCF